MRTNELCCWLKLDMFLMIDPAVGIFIENIHRGTCVDDHFDCHINDLYGMSARYTTQGSYNGHLYLGDLRCLMNGMLNIYRLCHNWRRFDCAINLFRQKN